MQITAELCWGGSQNVSIWTPLVLICAGQMPAPNGGFACACRLADSHGPLTVSPSDTAVDRRIRIGQDGGAVSAVVIDRSRTVLMERCRLIVR